MPRPKAEPDVPLSPRGRKPVPGAGPIPGPVPIPVPVPVPVPEPVPEPVPVPEPEFDLPFVEKPSPDLEGLSFDVGPLANEKKVLDKALSLIEDMEPPWTIARVNERTRHLAIEFHEIGEGNESVIALTCPMEPEGATVYDAASATITALHGDIDAALLQGVHAELKNHEGLAAEAARCVIGGFLIHMMPTSVIGKTVTMLSDAVRGMREKAEQKELEAAKDFVQTQGIAESVRHAEIDGDRWSFESPGTSSEVADGTPDVSDTGWDGDISFEL
ncbi:hypothetical protein [Streptomyces graminofaciens]|uniref:hypothetical protein n=1 Tax=Streptomyces graminofaciens TaxID=68212 RepID=UPI002573951D|nr:hypothetical protein [Streptomyces graminofaciens]